MEPGPARNDRVVPGEPGPGNCRFQARTHRHAVHGGSGHAGDPADLSFNWISDKRRSGDGAVPEGRYRVVARKSGAQTRYHKALLLDYPNAEDRRRFDAERRAGTIPASASIGGLIEIHGHGGRGVDWTDGCVAITNPEIDELFARVAIGTPVTVVGGEAPAGLDDFLTSEGPSIGWR